MPTINGSVRGSTNTLTTSDIVDVFERVLTAAHSQTTTIAVFNSTPHGAAGALDLDSSLTVAGVSTLTGNIVASDSLTVADGISVTGGVVSVGNSTVNVFMTQGGNVTADGHISAGGDVDIVGEVNAASAAITGAAVIGTTLALLADKVPTRPVFPLTTALANV